MTNWVEYTTALNDEIADGEGHVRFLRRQAAEAAAAKAAAKAGKDTAAAESLRVREARLRMEVHEAEVDVDHLKRTYTIGRIAAEAVTSGVELPQMADDPRTQETRERMKRRLSLMKGDAA